MKRKNLHEDPTTIKKQNTDNIYDTILEEISDRIDEEYDVIANTANVSAILYIHLNQEKNNAVNWAGFYIVKKVDQLWLGPFQGKPACKRINFGEGVCGTAAKMMETQLVPNVHEFPGHIACDDASMSEIVVPVIVDGKTVAVIDLDSSELDMFGEEDRKGLEKVAQILAEKCDWGAVVMEE